MAKPKALPNMRPRKKTALDPSEAEKVARGKTWRLNIGTPNEPAEEDLRFGTVGEMKRAATKALNEWLPWARRYNNAGVAEIEKAIAAVDALTTFSREPKIIDCAFDDYSGLTLRLIFIHN